ncbi:MAG TPA: ABC transporter ATPase [Bacteroidia bacterium]|nr:ABC transporter ATPase [Bacteroidia bacterium]
MYVDIDTMPGSSRIWIYQASDKMSDALVESVSENARIFIQSWTAHQADLKASFKIYNNLFLVVAVDESYNDASGCSIDKKVHFIKSVEQQTGLNFFDRMNVAYLSNDTIKIENMNNFSNLINSGQLNDQTIIFNNLVTNLSEFRESWKTPISKSWLMNLID